MAVEAGVLLMDEPLANLDPPHQADWLALARALAAAGRTVVSVLHEISSALQADEMVVMAAGRIVHQGACADSATHAALAHVFDRRLRVRVIKEGTNNYSLWGGGALDRRSGSRCPARPACQEIPRACVMVLGTTSGAGKSWLATALCRWYARPGPKVAPFKAQNMSNNARVVAGGEIGSAQYFQALAARAVPDVRMNPLLLKPRPTRTAR